MQRDENLLHIKNKLMPFTWVTVRPGRSIPDYSVYWTFIQTGRRSDSGFESVLTLINRDKLHNFDLYPLRR